MTNILRSFLQDHMCLVGELASLREDYDLGDGDKKSSYCLTSLIQGVFIFLSR